MATVDESGEDKYDRDAWSWQLIMIMIMLEHHHNHDEATISKVEDNSEKYKPEYGPTKQKIKQGFIFFPVFMLVSILFKF